MISTETVWPGRTDGRWFVMVKLHVIKSRTFYCCCCVFVLSSLFWLSSPSSFSSPSSLSFPSFPGLVINSCLGNTSALPPAGDRLLHCWLGALWCSVCGAERLTLHICPCTSPRETTLTLHSPEGYLQRRAGSIAIILTIRFPFC